LTQRKLTADSIAKARRAYKEIGGLYPETNAAAELVNASRFLIDVISYGTSDGKPPIQVDRVPTVADIGRRVKVRCNELDRWKDECSLVGFEKSGRFVVQSSVNDFISSWPFCIIDQEAGE
jgi:hypothetical protein